MIVVEQARPWSRCSLDVVAGKSGRSGIVAGPAEKRSS